MHYLPEIPFLSTLISIVLRPKFGLKTVSRRYRVEHGLGNPRDSFFLNLELISLGRHFVLKCFEAFGVFLARLSALILVL